MSSSRRINKHKPKIPIYKDKVFAGEIFKSKITTLLVVLTAVIIFVSWISQNYFQSKWLDNRIYLENTQFLIQIEQNNASFWITEFNKEQLRQPRNEPLLLIAAYNYIHSVISIFAWESSRISGGDTEPIEDKNLTEAYASKLYNNKDANGLIALAAIATQMKANRQDELNDRFGELLNESRDRSKRWNNRFLYLYILGTALFGLRWLLTSFYNWPSKLIRNSTSQ